MNALNDPAHLRAVAHVLAIGALLFVLGLAGADDRADHVRTSAPVHRVP